MINTTNFSITLIKNKEVLIKGTEKTGRYYLYTTIISNIKEISNTSTKLEKEIKEIRECINENDKKLNLLLEILNKK